MSDGLKKFFDPQTIPMDSLKAIPVDYFEKIRHKLKIAFAYPNEPSTFYEWNDPKVPKELFEFRSHGGKEVLVESKSYEQKIKELADSKS